MRLWLNRPRSREESAPFEAPQFVVHECGYVAEGIAEWNFTALNSPFWRLYHNNAEGCWVESGADRWPLTPEHIVLIPANLTFNCRSARRAPHLWLHFSVLPEYIFRGRSPHALAVEPFAGEHLRWFMSAMEAEGQPDLVMMHHHMLALLHDCFARRPLRAQHLPPALHHVLQFIESEPERNPSNAELAKVAGRSVSGFIRWFERHIGMAPAAYVRAIRLERAGRMLAFSDDSIEQIAARNGFANRYHFSRAFARHAGCAPATYRRRHQESQIV